MPAPVRTARGQWIEQGLQALAEGGPSAVRIEALAQELGVSKGGFYWHFDGRGALLDEMLDAWEATMIDRVIPRVEDAGTDPRVRLRRLFELASEVVGLLPIELAIRDWARHDRAVATRVARVDNRRMTYMRALFGAFCEEDDAEVRCLLVFSLFIGHPLIAADNGPRQRGEVVGRALERLLA